MKINTITCHDVYNPGASLQAYALARYLQKRGHDVRIIDYKPDYLSRHYSLTAVSNPVFDRPGVRLAYLAAKLPGRLRASKSLRKKRFDAFTEQYLPLTKKRYASCDELKADSPVADVYLAGSDQIWNTLFPNGRDPAFYLDFAPESAVRASYAASFATDDVADDCRAQVASWLGKLDLVSVREASAVQLAASLGRTDAVQVPDPVFLLTADEWNALASGADTPDAPYVLVYDFDNNPKLAGFARKKADELGCRVLSVFPSEQADITAPDAGPLEFLDLVRNASCVVSNSFHATAFAILFGVPFAVFDRGEKINTRMRDLLDAFDRAPADDRKETDPAPLAAQRKRAENYLNQVLTLAEKRQT